MERPGFNSEIESVLLTTLVTLMPTNTKLLRRVRFLLLMALLMRAWMRQQAQLNGSTAASMGYLMPDANGETVETNGQARRSRTSRRKANA
jgi:hypothetical protein